MCAGEVALHSAQRLPVCLVIQRCRQLAGSLGSLGIKGAFHDALPGSAKGASTNGLVASSVQRPQPLIVQRLQCRGFNGVGVGRHVLADIAIQKRLAGHLVGLVAGDVLGVTLSGVVGTLRGAHVAADGVDGAGLHVIHAGNQVALIWRRQFARHLVGLAETRLGEVLDPAWQFCAVGHRLVAA